MIDMFLNPQRGDKLTLRNEERVSVVSIHSPALGGSRSCRLGSFPKDKEPEKKKITKIVISGLLA